MKKIILILSLIILSFSGSGKILMTPWLQAVTTNSVFVLVECSSNDTVTVDYGLTDTYGLIARTMIISPTTASPVTYVHKVRLEGLQPNTSYFYRAKQGTSTVSGSRFHTAVEPGTSFRFGWMADFRTNIHVHDTIALLFKHRNPLFSLYGGDLCMNGTYKMWKDEFFRPNELQVIAEIPFFNTTGNHEGTGINTGAFLQNPASASNSQQYYSFDYGDLHVLCINTEIPMEKGSPQYAFAAADLAGTSKIWKVVFSHAPAYCAGGHGENKEMVALTKDLFEPNNVVMVISGHTHFYQHNLVNGIHHLIIGSAGAPLYEIKKAKYTLVSAKEYNYAIFDVTPDKITMEVYNEKDVKLDSMQLDKNSRK